MCKVGEVKATKNGSVKRALEKTLSDNTWFINGCDCGMVEEMQALSIKKSSREIKRMKTLRRKTYNKKNRKVAPVKQTGIDDLSTEETSEECQTFYMDDCFVEVIEGNPIHDYVSMKSIDKEEKPYQELKIIDENKTCESKPEYCDLTEESNDFKKDFCESEEGYCDLTDGFIESDNYKQFCKSEENYCDLTEGFVEGEGYVQFCTSEPNYCELTEKFTESGDEHLYESIKF